MNAATPWEVQTQELLDRVEREIDDVKADMQKRVAALEHRKWALEESLVAYREMTGIEVIQSGESLSRDDVQNKTNKEILCLIASRNDNLLVVRHATKLMKQANVFGNPLNADAVVYSILNRAPEFVKVGKGVYKLNGTHMDDNTPVVGPGKRSSGLRDLVKALKEKNPDMTKAEIKQTLIREGFDFGTKKPGNAINMAWVALGYASQALNEAPLLPPS